MLKKTSVAGCMLLATAAGAVMTTLPAFAEPTYGGGCCSSTHFRHYAKNRNWSGNENENLNRIRLRVHNRNNNVAVARNGRGEEGLGLGIGGVGGVGGAA